MMLDSGFGSSFHLLLTSSLVVSCEAVSMQIQGSVQQEGQEWVMRVHVASPDLTMTPPTPEQIMAIIEIGHLPNRPDQIVHADKRGVTKKGVQTQLSNIWGKMLRMGKAGRPHWSPEHQQELENWLCTAKRQRVTISRVAPPLALMDAPRDDQAVERDDVAAPPAHEKSGNAPRDDRAVERDDVAAPPAHGESENAKDDSTSDSSSNDDDSSKDSKTNSDDSSSDSDDKVTGLGNWARGKGVRSGVG